MEEGKDGNNANGAASSASANNKMRYGGFDRFVVELEFVQMLANPRYLHYLAQQKLLDNEEFVAYLQYLNYFRQAKYVRYLQYPGPTLRALELLQEEQFRKDIVSPLVTERLWTEGLEAALEA